MIKMQESGKGFNTGKKSFSKLEDNEEGGQDSNGGESPNGVPRDAKGGVSERNSKWDEFERELEMERREEVDRKAEEELKRKMALSKKKVNAWI